VVAAFSRDLFDWTSYRHYTVRTAACRTAPVRAFEARHTSAIPSLVTSRLFTCLYNPFDTSCAHQALWPLHLTVSLGICATPAIPSPLYSLHACPAISHLMASWGGHSLPLNTLPWWDTSHGDIHALLDMAREDAMQNSFWEGGRRGGRRRERR